MANKKINELIEKAVVNANDLVFIGDPVTGWLYNTTIADLQVGSITGGLAGSGQAGYVPRFKTAQTLENSLLFNGASGIGIGTTFGSHYLSLNGDYARTIGLERSTLLDSSGILGLTISAGGSASGMLNVSGGDLILKSGVSTGDGLSAIRLFTSTSGVSGTQDNPLIEQVSVLGNGNVGFGVINPTYKVEVDGNIGNGEYGIDTSFITFNNAPTSVPTTPGTLRWNDTDGTLEFTMKGGNVTQQIGQELPILVKHADNSGLIEGKVVYSVGSDGGNLTVRYANSNMETTSSTTFGVMTESATGGAKAFCTTFGLVRDFDTSSLVEGQAIWLDSVDGGMTTTKPIQPKHLVYIGVCLRSHATNGVIFVNVTNGQELEELHDVLITNRQNNQALIYDSATSLWKNRTIIGANGYIPYWDSTDLFKQSPLLVSSSGTTVTMNGMNLLLNDSGTLNYITKFGSTKTVINSLLYDTGTKVGIGTTNPEFLFTVVGGSMGVYSSSTNYGYIDTANTSMRLVSANGFNFTANNIGTIANTRVDANGNWGFGIGTPTYKVDVNGDVNTNGIYRINGSPLSTSNITEGTNLYFTSNRVLGQVLTGLNVSLTGVVTAADSLIVGISKLQNQVSSIVSGVSSVFGRTGAVVAQSGDYNTSQVTESTNLYYTDARARNAISGGIGISYNNTTGLIAFSGTLYTDSSIRALFSAGSGISYNNTTGVITSTITQYTDAMARASLSFVAGSGAYNSTTGVITIPTNTNQLTNGANFITLASLSASSPLSYNSGTGAFSISQATTSTNGYLSSNDWNTFNNKQNALTNPVTGTGTTNYVPKWTSGSAIGNSLIYDNGSGIGIGTTSFNEKFNVNGAIISIGNLANNQTSSAVFDFYQNNARVFSYGSSGVTGNILFYTGSGGSNANEIVRFNSGGNVSIGNTNNTYKLDVSGTGRFTASANTYAGGSMILTSNTGGTNIYLTSVGGLFAVSNGGSADHLLLNSSGNLGLGVTPNNWNRTTFQINSGSIYSIGGELGFVINAYNDGSWKYINNAGTSFSVQVNNEFYWFSANAGTPNTSISFTRRMTLDGSGNLGLGVTPSAWGTNDKAIEIGGSNSSTYTGLNVTSIGKNTYYDGTNWVYKQSSVHSTLYQQSYLGNHVWYLGGTGTAGTAISLTQAMTLGANGNLLVGTTSDVGYRLSVRSSANGDGIYYTDGTVGTWMGSLSSVATIGATTNHPLAIYTNGSEKVRVNAGGNVSIGNTNNTYKLDVSGTSMFRGDIRTSSGNLSLYANSVVQEFYDSANSNYLYILQNYSSQFRIYNANTATTILNFSSTGSATFSSSVTATTSINGASVNTLGTQSTFRITSNYAGSGDIPSGTLMYLDDNTYSNLGLIPSSAGTAGSKIAAVAYNGSAWRSMWEFSNVSSGNPNLILVKNGGNVGIGTTSPSVGILHLNYNSVNNRAIRLQDQNGIFDIITSGASQNHSFGLYDETNSAYRLFVLNNGNVGINTTNPGGTLHVAGGGSVIFGSTPNFNYKFNVQGFSGKYISFWTPTIQSVNNNGLMSHDGNGLTGLTPMGYNATIHVFNGEVTGGGTLQVAGDVNISGAFKINGTAIGTGGGGVSGSGTTNYIPMWSGSTSLTNSNIYCYPSSSETYIDAKKIGMRLDGGSMDIKFYTDNVLPQGALLNMNLISTDYINRRTNNSLTNYGGLRFSSIGRVSFWGDENSYAYDGNYAFSIISGLNSNSYHTTYTTLTGNSAYVSTRIGNNYTSLQMGVSGSNDAFIGGLTSYNSNSNLVLGANRFGTGMYSTLYIKWNTISLPFIPTSSSGLSSGDVYRDGSGYLRIV